MPVAYYIGQASRKKYPTESSTSPEKLQRNPYPEKTCLIKQGEMGSCGHNASKKLIIAMLAKKNTARYHEILQPIFGHRACANPNPKVTVGPLLMTVMISARSCLCQGSGYPYQVGVLGNEKNQDYSPSFSICMNEILNRPNSRSVSPVHRQQYLTFGMTESIGHIERFLQI